jgi:hypothetical protein
MGQEPYRAVNTPDISPEQQEIEESTIASTPLLPAARLIALPMHLETEACSETPTHPAYLQEEAPAPTPEKEVSNELEEAFYKVKESRLGKNVPENYAPENSEKRLMDDFIKKFTQEVKDSLHNRGSF